MKPASKVVAIFPVPSMPLAAAAAVVMALAAPAMAQRQGLEYIDQANARGGLLPGTNSVDEVLFPAIAAMDPPPAVLAEDMAAMFMVPGDPGWDQVAAWAQGEAQQEVLDRLIEATDYAARYRMTTPYGTEAVSEERLAEGLVIDLGPQQLLAAADFQYIDRLDEVVKLASVEAARLASLGGPEDAERAIDILLAWFYLGRIMADREFAAEKMWGVRQMERALIRLRDVVYLFDYAFSVEDLVDAAARIELDKVHVDWITLPEGDRLAMQQLVARTMAERGGVSTEHFAATMGVLGSQEHPLRVFSEGAYWRNVAAKHAGARDTLEQLDKLYGDWSQRLTIDDLHDPLLHRPSDYAQLDSQRFALLRENLEKAAVVSTIRLPLLTEINGTRAALGVKAFRIRQGVFPNTISAIAPSYVGTVPLDPYNWMPRFEQFANFQFFVPIRDDRSPGNFREPHVVRVGVISSRTGSGGGGPALDFATFPMAALNIAEATADTGAIQEWWRGELQRLAPLLTPETNAEFFRMLIDAGIGPDDAGEELEQKIADALPVEFTMALRGMDIESQQLSQALARLVEATLQTSQMRQAYAAAEAGEAISSDMMRTALAAAGQAALQPETLEPVLAVAQQAMQKMSDLMDEELGGDGSAAFLQRIMPLAMVGAMSNVADAARSTSIVELDDTVFVLYSVGPDGVPQAAEHVGFGGSDILFWPPVLSLQRHIQSQSARGIR